MKEHLPLLSHLVELRRNLIVSGIALFAGFIVALLLYNYIIDFLYTPLLQISSAPDGEILYINTIAEGFLVRLKISLLGGFVLSMPVHAFNTLRFIFPGLLKKEKRIISLGLGVSFFVVVGSFLYSYYTILPVSIAFLTGKGFIPENTGMLLSFGSNIFYILQVMLVGIIVFQLPIIVEILLILNVVKRASLLKMGKYLVVLFFLLSAIVTPPDFVTQIALALPMTALFYLAILIAKIFKFGEK